MKKTQINGIYHTHELEELILLKYSSYPNNLQIHCKPYQNTNCIFHRTRTNNPKICRESQKTPNSQNNPEKDQSWSYQVPWFQTILQSYGNQNSMVLAQKQTHRSMEQDREPRNKPTNIGSISLWQKRQEYTMEKGQSPQQVVLGKLDSRT